MKKYLFQFCKLKINKERKDFLIWGICNVFFTNIFLQILLIFLEIKTSTFLSQLFNILFGYLIYSKKVFKVKKYSFKKLFFYIILAFASWIFNWITITKLNYLGLSVSLAAIIVIPLLALNSYLIQKYLIFKKDIIN